MCGLFTCQPGARDRPNTEYKWNPVANEQFQKKRLSMSFWFNERFEYNNRIFGNLEVDNGKARRDIVDILVDLRSGIVVENFESSKYL